MSDYLSRIVGRLRSPKANAMQPILPALFEPGGADALGFSMQDIEEPTSPQTEARRREPPIRPAKEGEILRNTPAHIVLKSEPHTRTGSQVVAEAPKEIRHHVEAAEEENGVPSLIEHNVIEKIRASLHPLSETQGLGTSTQLSAQGGGFDAGTGQHATPSGLPREEPLLSHQTSAHEEQDEPSLRVEHRTIIQEAPAPPPEVIAALKTARPPGDRRIRSHATTSRARDLHSPERSEIRVTIGRVEVRAMTTPTALPAQKPPVREPKVSLDDYLRSRNGIAR